MSKIYGIKSNNMPSFTCGYFNSIQTSNPAPETIASIRSKVMKTGVCTVLIQDSDYGLSGYGCVTANVIDDTHKFIQITTDYRIIVLYTTDGTSWTEGQYENRYVNEILDPQLIYDIAHQTTGLTWIRYGRVVEVAGKPTNLNYNNSINGLPNPIHRYLAFYGDSNNVAQAKWQVVYDDNYFLLDTRSSSTNDIITFSYLTNDLSMPSSF